ncbi:hypothetical protein [Sphaerochaeta sp.]|uniref:hypothetical protein n=1 Tax=Sphaerochaeta sp. TaxID=1972642 RepID=UPI002FC6555C
MISVVKTYAASKNKNLNLLAAQAVLQNHLLERFLERLSKSEHTDKLESRKEC